MVKADDSNSWYYDDDDDYDSVALPKDEEVPLSLFWFVDDTDTNKNRKEDVQNETKTLQNKVQSMEQDLSGKLHYTEEISIT